MQNLIKTLQEKIATMKQNGIDLSDERLDDLYSVFPFNKFEFYHRSSYRYKNAEFKGVFGY